MSNWKRLTVILALAAISTRSAGAQPRIYNTGVDASATALGLGQLDSHWRWIEGQSTEPLTGSGSNAVTNFYPGGWLSPSSSAQWISMYQGSNFPGDTWTTFYQVFDLYDYDPMSVQLTGLFGVDDIGAFFLNGQSVSVTYGAFDAFRGLNTLFVSGGFRQGSNTLAVQVHNSACNCTNPSGLLVQDLVLTGSPTVVPEPATQMLLLCGVVCIGVFHRRRTRQG